MPWDSAQYLRFADHRLRPAVDLLSRIDVEEPAEVYDLGAGAGNVTRLLKERWPLAHVTGVDDSAEMLRQAAADASDITWQEADLSTWKPAAAADVIFANAALHWLDEHTGLILRLFDFLRPAGVLAIQMPRNFSARSHTAITEAALAGPWRSVLKPLLRPDPVHKPSVYFDLLAPRSAALDMWETEYLQVLSGADPIKEWTKGTWLRPLLEALAEPQRGAFEACYARLVAEAYPQRGDGHTLYPFRRLFIIARAPS